MNRMNASESPWKTSVSVTGERDMSMYLAFQFIMWWNVYVCEMRRIFSIVVVVVVAVKNTKYSFSKRGENYL